MKLNQYQRAVLNDYSDGEFAHLSKQEGIRDVASLGDGLLSFILVELSDKEDCESAHHARRRMERAKDDLGVAITALEALEAEISLRERQSKLH